ncbi:ferredoxin [Chroococcidiopsis sp. CCALA 051]|uniref:2Fe-2S iron-sulfur cluster-binding protein n=1 Tax=Chroococcidiopsis sp. CCALA 051 TaxID=869949 RepID=UPI000D0CC82F|nr:2Fe-2S iron-sulfur cluster-binding protein [Chroococcidiopsis sp. CCALA 051]PSM47850.1 ferredoxin [Chroococcidiopsis sp. CCALA 051]
MKTYQIELVNRNNFTLNVAADKYILDAVEAAGLKLPVGCRYGACITCAARILSGEVEQTNAIALKPQQAAKGYVLLCIATPRSDCKFEVGVECQKELYVNPFISYQRTVIS